jgi:hypothetical protein
VFPRAGLQDTGIIAEPYSTSTFPALVEDMLYGYHNLTPSITCFDSQAKFGPDVECLGIS